MSASLLPKSVIEDLIAVFAIKYVNFITTAMMLYDFILTIPAEVVYIWPWEWRSGKILYLITRYGVIIDTALFNFFWFKNDLSTKGCENLFNIGCYVLHAGIMVAQWILVMRTYAIWSKSKIVLVVLSLFVLGIDVSTFYNLHKLLKSLTWTPSPFPSVIICVCDIPSNSLYINFAMIMALELVIVVLTIWKAVSHWQRHGRKTLAGSGLLGVLYRDGILFFFCLFAISLANFVLQVDTKLPTLYIFVLPRLQRVLHSILTSKIILHLREYTTRTPAYDTVGIVSGMEYNDYTARSGGRMTNASIPMSSSKFGTWTDDIELE